MSGFPSIILLFLSFTQVIISLTKFTLTLYIFSIFLNSKTFEDLRPIKIVSYFNSFFFLSSITLEKSLYKLLPNKTFKDFLSPFAKEVIIFS